MTIEKVYEIYLDRKFKKLAANELGYVDDKEETATFSGDWWPTVVWPGDVQSYLDSTDSQVRGVETEIDRARSNLPADFLSSWTFFREEWRKFFEEQKEGWHVFGASAVMDRIDTYVERLAGYQKKLVQLGAAKNVPPITEDPDSIYKPSPGGLSGVYWAGIGVAGTVAALLVAKAYSGTYGAAFNRLTR